MQNTINLPKLIADSWRANNGILFLVSDETYRVWQSVGEAVKRLQEDRHLEVEAWCHDKISGFYQETPAVIPPANKSNVLVNALAMALETGENLRNKNKDLVPPFNVQDNQIIMFRDPNFDLNEGPTKPSAVQILRNAIASNMMSPDFHGEVEGQPARGKRMFIFVSAVGRLPDDLPELDPVIVPLPDDDMLEHGIVTVIDPLVGGTHGSLSAEARGRIVATGHGFTYQKWEDALSLAIVENGGYADMNKFIQTLERRKSQMLEGIPGLTYISKDTIPFDCLPGYDEAVDFVRSRMSLSPEVAMAHNIQALKGITLVGAPGTGKTQFAMLMGKLTGRDLVLWSLGETQGGLVGQSEAQARRAIEIIRATKAVALIDDVDKAGLGVATSGRTGDGGTFGRMIQMLLTEMSRDDHGAIYVFTANRTSGLPVELIRSGRVDERFFVQLPDPITREHIIRVHANRFRMDGFDSDDGLKELAEKHTDGWVGAELADLVKESAIRSLTEGNTKLGTKSMIERASAIVPMARQEAFVDDIRAMEEAAKQFRPIGRVRPEKAASGKTTARAGRHLTL